MASIGKAWDIWNALRFLELLEGGSIAGDHGLWDLLVLLGDCLVPSFSFLGPALRFHKWRARGAFIIIRYIYYFLLWWDGHTHQLGFGRVLPLRLPIDRWAHFYILDGLAQLALKVSSIALGAQDCSLILLQTENRLAFSAPFIPATRLHRRATLILLRRRRSTPLNSRESIKEARRPLRLLGCPRWRKRSPTLLHGSRRLLLFHHTPSFRIQLRQRQYLRCRLINRQPLKLRLMTAPRIPARFQAAAAVLGAPLLFQNDCF